MFTCLHVYVYMFTCDVNTFWMFTANSQPLFGRDRPPPRLGGLHPAGGRPNPFRSSDRTHTR